MKRDVGWRGSVDGKRVFRTARRCSGTAITIRLGFTSAFEEKRYATARSRVNRFFRAVREDVDPFIFSVTMCVGTFKVLYRVSQTLVGIILN